MPGAMFDDGPCLILGAVAIIPTSIFHGSHRGVGWLKRDLKERGAGVDRIDANERTVRVLTRLHNGLSEDPRVRLNALLRTCGQLFVRLLKSSCLKGFGSADLAEIIAHTA